MSEFVVSARKYRPITFDTVVGQTNITSTLKNAIRNKHLAQAFLFCGPRGVGKTTCARILAKTINCSNISSNIEACNECESCRSFNHNQSLNIIELDAASNNSVDDIRSLVEQVRYAPQSGHYKIYIIDEVHMLSQSAFNAFLKTLEEPPSYAVFILATTEKHKIIPTIISRCQIFDFSRIRIEDMVRHLEWIAENEGVTAEHDALHIIAQKADGALRDALSVFDQMVSFAGNKLQYKDVIANLNILDYDYFFRIVDDLLDRNLSQVLITFNDLLMEGFDGHQFINGFSNHLRDLLVCRDESTLALLELSNSLKERYKKQSKKTEGELLFSWLEIANKCDVEYRTSKNQRLHVELALIRMCRTEMEVSKSSNPEVKTTGAIARTPRQSESMRDSESSDAGSVSAPAAAKEVHDKKISSTAASATFTENHSVPAQVKEPRTKSFTTSIRIGDQEKSENQKTDKPEKGKAASKNPDKLIEGTDEKKFTEIDLITAWNEFVEKVIDPVRQNLISSLRKGKPQRSSDGIIRYGLQNEVQMEEANGERNNLINYLRKQLGNYSLKVDFFVIPSESRNDDAYTDEEKFKKMAQKNPALEDLRKQFDLEF